MSHQTLELADREETTRTVKSVIKSLYYPRKATKGGWSKVLEYSPRVLAVAKEQVLWTGRGQLVLDRLNWINRARPCLGESERLEHQRVVVNLAIHADWAGTNSKMGALGNECAI